jgi:hypothetical protein
MASNSPLSWITLPQSVIVASKGNVSRVVTANAGDAIASAATTEPTSATSLRILLLLPGG